MIAQGCASLPEIETFVVRDQLKADRGTEPQRRDVEILALQTSQKRARAARGTWGSQTA